MRTSLFDFHLPDMLIASRPVVPRDHARMLTVDESLQDHVIRELPQFLTPGDVLVFNDTRVFPARLFGRRGEVKVEVLLHKPLAGEGEWLAFARPAKRLREGDVIIFAETLDATVTGKRTSGDVIVQFNKAGALLRQALDTHGHIPLPPYIAQQRADDTQDRTDYQTVFAREEGSVAAPTAGLHFTPELLAAIDALGVTRAYVTLHVGGGTFLPVKSEDTQDHVMHSERAQISAETAKIINETRARGGRIIAVGTTSLRTLESAADEQGRIREFNSDTDIFITPGYRFKAVDVLLTNFHLPCSTLFMLVCAFAGLERMRAAYAHAIRVGYRFYSYGDACLLYRNNT